MIWGTFKGDTRRLDYRPYRFELYVPLLLSWSRPLVVGGSGGLGKSLNNGDKSGYYVVCRAH